MSESPHQIVTIDDCSADTQLLQLAFDQLGEPYVLKVLPDGETAINHLKEFCSGTSPKPCLIIVDLHLPKYDGIEVVRSIRCDPAMSDVAIAVLTSHASPRERDTLDSLHVNLCRVKPMGWPETVDLARELFGLCKGPQKMAALA